MNRDDVIRMAREADPGFEGGADSDGTMIDPIVGIDQFLKFAALVAAAEREEFLKWCEASIEGVTPRTDWAKGYVMAIKNVTQGFRARGNQCSMLF